MRKIILGTYDTEQNGPWTLAECTFSAAVYQSNLVTVPGRHGPLDLTAALTDGEPRYDSRTLTTRLERSDGTRLEREAAITTMINWLDGWRMNITLPDDPEHYITGRVHIAREYNDPAHAAVNVTAVCDPWRYSVNETALIFTAETDAKPARLTNNGRRTVIPTLTIAGDSASVLLVYDSYSWSLGPGTYQLPDLTVPQGGVGITYSGSGTLSFVYREAIL